MHYGWAQLEGVNMREKKVVENWRIIVSGDCYNAPEVRRFHLQGEATWIEGDENKLTSSPIVGELDGAVVTRSGSVYHLGKREFEGVCSLKEMIERFPGVPLR